jgi:hypothetical protein
VAGTVTTAAITTIGAMHRTTRGATAPGRDSDLVQPAMMTYKAYLVTSLLFSFCVEKFPDKYST